MWIIFIHSSPVDGHCSCFCFLTVMNTTTMNICVQILTWTNVFFTSLGYIPRSEIYVSLKGTFVS